MVPAKGRGHGPRPLIPDDASHPRGGGAAITRLCAIAAATALVLLALPAGAQSFSTAVPAPDGTPLATDVYLPFGSGPWPVVLIRTPYGKDGESTTCGVLTLSGYACVAQDTRGRYDSGGEDTVFRDDGPDGRATLDWISGQWWCDGRIGTFGGSALGITQYMLAPGAGEALRCQVPVVATADLYHVAIFQGGVLRRSLVENWLGGQGSLWALDEMLAHRPWSDWWSPVDSVSRAREVTAAALHTGGWFDIFLQGTLDAFTAFQHRGGAGAAGRQYLVIGPWTHGGLGGRSAGELDFPSNAVINLPDLWLDFLGCWLKGDHNAVDSWPAVRIYLMGAVDEADAPGNRWMELDDWPPPASRRKLYLGSSGTLSWDVPGEGSVTLVADPADPVSTLGGANLFPDLQVDGRPMGAGPYDQRPVETRNDVLMFSTPPLPQPLTVVGRITARIRVLPDTPDLDLSLRLTDVYPDGRSMLLTDGIARARFRCGDDTECLLEPGVPADIDVDLWSTAVVFNRGHRIRIDIAGSNAPRFEVNPNDGTDPEDGSAGIVARPLILTGGGHPSWVELPVLPASRRPDGRTRSRGRAARCSG